MKGRKTYLPPSLPMAVCAVDDFWPDIVVLIDEGCISLKSDVKRDFEEPPRKLGNK